MSRLSHIVYSSLQNDNPDLPSRSLDDLRLVVIWLSEIALDDVDIHQVGLDDFLLQITCLLSDYCQMRLLMMISQEYKV